MNKSILVTGSTEGIGKAIALGLAEQGARVILHGKDAGKIRSVASEISKKGGNTPAGILVYDFSSQKEVCAMAQKIRLEYPDLGGVIHNAGILAKHRELTSDGLEKTFAVNHMAPFILTGRLLDLLKKNTPSRVVTVSSYIHEEAVIDFENLQGEKRFSPYSAYTASKLCNVLFAYALARRLKGAGVTSNVFHPGIVNTKLLREAGPRAFIRFMRAGFRPAERAAETGIYLAHSPEAETISGKYFIDKRPVPSSPASYDESLQEKLWESSERFFVFKKKAVICR